MIFVLARFDTQAATNALINVEAHEPFVLRWVVTFRRLRTDPILFDGGLDRSRCSRGSEARKRSPDSA
jgi:hypothetical protein